jgi:hypothetical protein
VCGGGGSGLLDTTRPLAGVCGGVLNVLSSVKGMSDLDSSCPVEEFSTPKL